MKDHQLNRFVKQFPNWRKEADFQGKMGSPFVGYVPELKDVIAMMDFIELVMKKRKPIRR